MLNRLPPGRIKLKMIDGLLEHVRVVEHDGEVFHAGYEFDVDGTVLVQVYCWDEECGWNAIEKDDVPIVVYKQFDPR